ncbi:MAG: hypothetical protein LAT51_03190 [Flavobacteriaceae bacterium]|nr:hypothetical protein [Flavobacteriaceae bacterium]
MDTFFKLPSYLFHPLWMPILGVSGVYYFFPISFDQINIISDLVVVFFSTIVIPLLFLLLLKKTKIIESLHLKKVKERKLPVLFFTCIAAFIINFIFPPESNQLFFYFFSGIFFSGILASVFTISNFKISLHMIGLSGIVAFIYMILSSFHFNTIIALALAILLLSWLASSRIYMKAHTTREILIGVVVGAVPQIYFFNDLATWLD